MSNESNETGSVTHWITQLRLGNACAAQELWQRYYERLVRLSHKRLIGSPLLAADEEDVVQSAFAAFCRGVDAGRFPRLHDRDDLWRMLVTITARKTIDYVRRERSQKRGEGRRSDFTDKMGISLEEIVGNEPGPEFVVQTAETFRELLDRLPRPSLRALVLAKLEGCTNEEVAERVGCSVRTVERRLQVIRELWQSSAP